MNPEFAWNLLDKYFQDNPTALVDHHLNSFNNFFEHGINQIFREKNPIKIMKEQNTETRDYRLKANIYLAGREGNKIYYGKPIIFDDNNEHYMYPNEARLRNFTYGISIHYDVDIEYFITEEDGKITEKHETLSKIFLGRFPIMLRSKLCILNGFDKNVRYTMGECKNDSGGYFILDGKEKVIISQEKFADNMLYIRDKVNDLYSHSAEIRSVSEDASKPIRTLAIRIVSPSASLTNNQIVVNVPNVRKPVPLFILMRALGVISDKAIIESCLLDIEKYKNYVDLFIPSIHDAGKIFTQKTALNYIKTFTKGKTVSHVLDILMNYLLPNIGELNFRDKACYIGYMVFELLKVFRKENKPTDRDSFKYKRVELPGTLLYDLFKEYYTLQQKNIYQKIDKEYFFKKGLYGNDFTDLINNNYKEFFSERIVETGFRKAFKGSWGSEEHTKRLGIVQGVPRLSFNSYISIMRKINLPFDSSAKVVGPRLLHSSQWGKIDPVDTPDGGNIGLHKHMAILVKITEKCSGKPIIDWLRLNSDLRTLDESSFLYLSKSTKVFVNGSWIGVLNEPEKIKNLLLDNRRSALIPIYTSISWEIKTNSLFIYTDSGRLSHPVFYINYFNKRLSFDNEKIIKNILDNNFTWNELISGFEKKNESFNIDKCDIYNKVDDLYGTNSIDKLRDSQAIIEYIDTAEEETSLICVKFEDLTKHNQYTHMEIHPSLILGVMGNQIIFPENNPLPRDLFSCGQSKQAISMYHTNFNNRFDKMSVVLNYGQLPLVKSRYFKYINNEEHAYGINVIVAISCYGGYNVEDSVLFNKSALDRGLFRNTYYNTYETFEESSTNASSTVDSRFANIEKNNVIGLKPGYDYSELDETGLIKENTLLDEKKVLIGKTLTNLSNPSTSLDASVFTKKGQLGYVDKTFITEGEEGFRIAKVRVRDERIPVIGDKFCSRCGQKGTIGLVIDEENMPFTADGIKPDIIINPHALPSRMTIGQLLETVMGKSVSEYGGFAECTAFNNNGSKYESFGKLLTKAGFNSTANEILYNGESGEQMTADIFIGPTYYMRLKQLVKDKINYRARGPRTVLTRQTVQGRANDGGLRVGEQERDAIIGHGLSHFLQESMLIRGDEYFVGICNTTGMISIYNENLNLFMSPLADGPIKFTGATTGTVDNDNLRLDKITRFGRSFSIVRIPYAFKLLLQELGTMNINMRIITEDNIDQISSMSFNTLIDSITDPKIKSVNTKKSLVSRNKTLADNKINNKYLDENSDENSDKNSDSLKEFDILEDLKSSDGKKQPPVNEPSVIDTITSIPETASSFVQNLFKSPQSRKIDTSETKEKTLIKSNVPQLIENTKTNTQDNKPTLENVKTDIPIATSLDEKLIQKLPDVPDNKVVIVDDPEEPDILEEEKLKILTDIDAPKEDLEDDSTMEKSVSIN